jgi:hypothetical protein
VTTTAPVSVDTPPSNSPRRERLAVVVLVVAAVLIRTAVFVCWEHSSFDSDQAVVGLMAKHISEGRAFPLFFYGQNYLLAVQAWLAAPVFLVLGPTVLALKLPLLVLNLAVALLLVHLLQRDAGLRPAFAGMAAAIFVLAPVGMSAQLMNALGVSVEPFLYVLLIWVWRARPVWLGVVLGVGFLHREFTAYGFLAILVVGLCDRSIWTRKRLTELAVAVVVAVMLWNGANAIRPYANAAGPGTTGANVAGPPTNVRGLLDRICSDPRLIVKGFGPLFGSFLGLPVGLTQAPLAALSINSLRDQGAPWLWPIFGLACLAGLIRVAWLLRSVPGARAPSVWAFPAYLFVTGAITALAYDVGRCGELHVMTMRYALLVILAPIGLAAAWLRTEPRLRVRSGIVTFLGVWSAYSLAGHGQLLNEYIRHTPPAYRRVVADYLVAHHIGLARSEYWTGYHVTFLARERVVVATDGVWRVLSYHEQEKASPGRAYTISRRSCPDGRGVEVYPGVYWVCNPP